MPKAQPQRERYANAVSLWRSVSQNSRGQQKNEKPSIVSQKTFARGLMGIGFRNDQIRRVISIGEQI